MEEKKSVNATPQKFKTELKLTFPTYGEAKASADNLEAEVFPRIRVRARANGTFDVCAMQEIKKANPKKADE